MFTKMLYTYFPKFTFHKKIFFVVFLGIGINVGINSYLSIPFGLNTFNDKTEREM